MQTLQQTLPQQDTSRHSARVAGMTQAHAPRIRARGRSFLALILSPEAPLTQWLDGLDEQMNRSVGFLQSRPVILDLSLLEAETEGLASLQQDLRDRGLFLLSIEGGERSWPALKSWDWPHGPTGGRASGPVTIPETEPESSTTLSSGNANYNTAQNTGDARLSGSGAPPLVVSRSVRSGQSIQHPDGDIVVMGAVSSGAEIIAGGSVHIYGPLRGRAIAGLDGRSDARIYTLRLEAELLALDGFYMTADEINPDMFGKAVQVFLSNESLTVTPLLEERR